MVDSKFLRRGFWSYFNRDIVWLLNDFAIDECMAPHAMARYNGHAASAKCGTARRGEMRKLCVMNGGGVRACQEIIKIDIIL